MKKPVILFFLAVFTIFSLLQIKTFSQSDETSILPPDDPLVGKNLFTGVTPFSKGGPACIACHSIAGISALGGGALGPDLTASAPNFGGEQGLGVILSEMTAPENDPAGKKFTMRPIFTKYPLTPEEQSDISAFMLQASTSQTRPASSVQLLFLLAAGGAVFLIIVAQIIWGNRSTGIRKQLIDKP